MYKEHPAFQSPKNENAKIWRYMDFTKFVSLLDTSSLFFTRVDTLDDPFEGSCPIEVLQQIHKKLNIATEIKYARGFFALVNKFTAVNCWHINEYESAAMWKSYLKSNEGIAIQSTFKHLKDSLRDMEHDIFIGEVRYIDYDKLDTLVDPNEVFEFPVIFKRKVFQHEQELRAVIRKFPEGGLQPSSKPTINLGIPVPVDLAVIIDKIYLAPTSSAWQLELLESVIKKYKLNKEIVQSSIYDKPLLK
jgi:hypothetical protein